MEQLTNEQSYSRTQSERPPELKKKCLFSYHNLKLLSVEPVMILYMTSSMMVTLTTENLNLEKACLVNLGFDKNVCQALVERNSSGYTAVQEVGVQKLVSNMLIYKTAIQGIVPFLLLLFVGSWSDKRKRRVPLILSPIYGDLVSSLGCMLCSFFFMELPIEVAIFFEAIPTAITGYWFCFYVGNYSFITERSTKEDRTIRVGIVTLFTHVSLTAGIALSGLTYKFLGFYGVYALSIVMFILATTYGLLVLKDEPNSYTVASKDILRDVFDLKHIARTFSVCLEKRKYSRRLKMILILVLVLLHGTYRGELSVAYMFVRRKFTWDAVDYSGYNTYHSITHMIGALFCLTVFVKWMCINDATLGMLAMISKIIGCFGSAFASNPLMFYLASLTEVLNGSAHIALRAILSKLVSSHELSKTFCLFGLCEALSSFFCGPLYSYVYHQTVEKFPGSFYFLSAGLHCIAFFIFMWLYILKEEEDDYEKNGNLKNESEKMFGTIENFEMGEFS